MCFRRWLGFLECSRLSWPFTNFILARFRGGWWKVPDHAPPNRPFLIKQFQRELQNARAIPQAGDTAEAAGIRVVQAAWLGKLRCICRVESLSQSRLFEIP